MMFCMKHNCWYSGAKCDKCLAGDKPYLYTRDEVANPDDWKLFIRRGWVESG